MKNLLTGIAFLLTVHAANAQTATQLRDQARTLLQQGDFDKAILALQQAKRAEPANMEVMKDLSFANYLKRDFAAAIEAGKQLVEMPDADQQAFQILGLSYKAIAATKEASKLYRTALQKFPASGVIRNEYGELLAMEKSAGDAIEQWEKGIEGDPNYSSNYYNAAMYYNTTGNWLRAALYGEIFLNLESFTKRTDDMRPVVLNAYRRLLAPGAIASLQSGKLSPFEKEVLAALSRAAANAKEGSLESLVDTRKQFLAAWAPKREQYHYRLFDHQQQMAGEGLFEAYNYWLFGNAVNATAYKTWQDNHPKEQAGFAKFQESKVFKIPPGEHYFN